MNIDSIVELIEWLATFADPATILAKLKPFLPAPVYAVAKWAVDHKDCLSELIAALKGSFASDGTDLSAIEADVAACRALAG